MFRRLSRLNAMSHLIIFLICLSQIYAQNDLLKLFQNTTTSDPFANLIEVTSVTSGSIGALEKCGEGSDAGIHMCVVYYRCDPTTNIITPIGKNDGFGLIDIRIQENECEHYMDKCCLVSNAVQPNSPEPPFTSRPVVTPSTPPPSPRPSLTACGIRNPNGIDFKITGNKNGEAEYGEFPWMVALLWSETSTKTGSFCGGSLIAPNVVLTGAHCVSKVNLNEIKVRAGEWDTQTTKERLPFQERSVSQVIIHENFVPQVVFNDIALLVLNTPFEIAENVGTICLPEQDQEITSRNCFASGWGKDIFGKEGQYQVILKKIELPMVQLNECQQTLRTTRLGSGFNLDRSFICAGGEAGKDTCTGDGGGPLVCPDPNNPTRYIQSGTVAWGIGCGERNIPGVYANVATFRRWIDNQFSRLNINSNSYII